MKILITGGAGFIASHVADKYIEAGHEVRIVDNLSSGNRGNINPKAMFSQVDINDKEALAEVIEEFQPEVINHHAAQINVRVSVDNPELDAKINILGTINLLEIARHTSSVRHIIFASTGGAIYGDADIIPTPENYPAWPISPYGIAKLTVEHYLYYYHHLYKLGYTVLRYGNVYGPRQNPHGEAGVVAIFYNKAKAGESLRINGDGEQTRDFVYVGDVADANLKALEKMPVGSFNIGTSIKTSVNELTDGILATLPNKPEVLHSPAKDGEQQTSCLDISKASQILEWKPSVNLAEGLSKTAEYFLNK